MNMLSLIAALLISRGAIFDTNMASCRRMCRLLLADLMALSCTVVVVYVNRCVLTTTKKKVNDEKTTGHNAGR